MLEQLLCTTVHGIRHQIMGWQGCLIPLEFLRLAAIVTHEHQAEKGGDNDHTQNDENHIGVQGTAVVISRIALNTVGLAGRSRVLTCRFVVRFERHQNLLQSGDITGIIGGDLFLCICDIGLEVAQVPSEQFIIHFARRRQRFGGEPFCGFNGLVFLSADVHCTNGKTDVIHVSHAVGPRITAVTIRGREVHFLAPTGDRARHVKVVFPKSIAGAGELVAKRPRDGNHGVHRRTISQ